MRYPTKDGWIAIIKGPQAASHIAYRNATPLAKESTLTIREAPEVEKEKISPVDTTKLVIINGKTIDLRTTMNPKLKGQVIVVLRQNQGSFVWKGEALTQVEQNIISHKLNIDPCFLEKKQKH